jgi:hypothetical protein
MLTFEELLSGSFNYNFAKCAVILKHLFVSDI